MHMGIIKNKEEEERQQTRTVKRKRLKKDHTTRKDNQKTGKGVENRRRGIRKSKIRIKGNHLKECTRQGQRLKQRKNCMTACKAKTQA